MPRKAKTLSGATAQPVGPVAGQMYGAGVDQMQLQEQLPAPNSRADGRISVPVAPAQGPQGAPVDPHQAALTAAQAMPVGAGLLARSDRPGEPVTTGLPFGPGAGPEVLALRQGNPTGNLMRELAQKTGDPYFAELAMRAGL